MTSIASHLPVRFPARLQDLPPRLAHLCLRVERFLRTQIEEPGGTWLIAVSGGSDSVALLLICRWLQPRLGVRIAAAHLDHGLRDTSCEDADFVSRLCKALDIPLHRERSDVSTLAQERELGLEEAGRDARYDFLAQEAVKIGASLAAVGHTLNDLAEDQLLRLTRGTGWPELAGMTAHDRGRGIVRPLLMTPRAELRTMLRELAVPWREDASNRDPFPRRNHIRHHLLPQFEEMNPSYLRSAARLWHQARQDRDFLDQILPEPEHGTMRQKPALRLARTRLESLHPALRLRTCKRVLETLGPGQPLWENLLRLENAFTARKTGTYVQFPGGKRVLVERDALVFFDAGPPEGNS